jgi:large subunit ribosomal protein L28e
MNKHSRKYSGFVNDKAIGVQPAPAGGVTLITKKTKQLNRPASSKNEISWSANKSGPKVYKGIVNQTAERGYRLDLRQEAIARASAIRLSQETKKDLPEKKVRGAKAKEASRKKS